MKAYIRKLFLDLSLQWEQMGLEQTGWGSIERDLLTITKNIEYGQPYP